MKYIASTETENMDLDYMGRELIRVGWNDGFFSESMKTGALLLIANALNKEKIEDKHEDDADLPNLIGETDVPHCWLYNTIKNIASEAKEEK